MRNIITLLWLALSSLSAVAQIQAGIPEAPKKVEFANIIVELSPEAQALVNKEIVGLLTPQNNYLDQKLERMQLFFPLIERILKEEDVPEDFKYMAVVESSLNPESISSSNAIGFWQFKEATGRELGLKIDNAVDERKHIYFSTKAAALYLKKNNLLFKNWVSSMLAHAMGPGGAASAVPVEWSFANEIRFTETTNRYLIKAIAHRIAYEHRLNRLRDSPRKFIEYNTRGKSLAEIAVELTVDINELRKFNSWLYAPSIPEDKDYLVLVPVRVEDTQQVVDKIRKRSDLKSVDVGYPVLKRMTVVSTSPDDPILYEINGKKGILAQPGDEVAQMSEKAKVKIKKFLRYNDMTDKDITREGQIYYLQPKNTKGPVPFYTVRNQQNMWEISQIYAVKLKSLLKFNRMKKDEPLQVGRVVWMQKRRPKSTPVEIIQDAIPERPSIPVRDTYDPVVRNTTPPPAEVAKEETPKEEVKPPVVETKPEVQPEKTVILPEKPPVIMTDTPKRTEVRPEPKNTGTTPSLPKKHVVKQGETLFSIAKKYNMTAAEIRQLNNMGPGEPLKYGQTLILTGTPSYQENQVAEEPVVREPRIPASGTVVARTHKVERGETLFSIARKYDLKVADLRRFNNFGPEDVLKYGQTLKVSEGGQTAINTGLPAEPAEEVRTPKPLTAEARPAPLKTHVVSRGETLFSIARKYDVTMQQLQDWNNLSDRSVDAGQKLKIGEGPSPSPQESGSKPVKHKVERGDTLYSIAKKYGVSQSEIKELNNLESGNVQLGKVLIIKR